jgi:predicted nucleotide-binding protein
MAKARHQSPAPPSSPLRLRVPLANAREKIVARIAAGRELPMPTGWDELELCRQSYYKWNDYNAELLRQLFTNDEPREDYTRFTGMVVAGGRPDFEEELRDLQNDIKLKIHRLESLVERLELIPLTDEIVRRVEHRPPVAAVSQRVFVVHGHDDASRELVARFITKLGFEPVILHEQPNQGRTLIEKLEGHSDVGFAVVLLTPDDEGREAKDGAVLNPRARQNVILELGYFLGKLGRKNVCALHKASVELPSDYLGVLFVPLDEGGGWQLKLAKELRIAGFPVDMNKAV